MVWSIKSQGLHQIYPIKTLEVCLQWDRNYITFVRMCVCSHVYILCIIKALPQVLYEKYSMRGCVKRRLQEEKWSTVLILSWDISRVAFFILHEGKQYSNCYMIFLKIRVSSTVSHQQAACALVLNQWSSWLTWLTTNLNNISKWYA